MKKKSKKNGRPARYCDGWVMLPILFRSVRFHGKNGFRQCAVVGDGNFVCGTLFALLPAKLIRIIICYILYFFLKKKKFFQPSGICLEYEIDYLIHLAVFFNDTVTCLFEAIIAGNSRKRIDLKMKTYVYESNGLYYTSSHFEHFALWP